MTQRYVVYEIWTRSRVVDAESGEAACATLAAPDAWPQAAFSSRHAVPVEIQPHAADAASSSDASIWRPGQSPVENPVASKEIPNA